MKRIKSLYTDPVVRCSQTLETGVYYEIQSFEVNRWANDDLVLADIGSGQLVVNNGESDLSGVSVQINFLKDLDSQTKDSDGSQIMQPKTTKLGWHFSPRTFCFKIGTAGSLYSAGPDGQQLTDISMKFFNVSGSVLTKGAEETDEEFQTRLDADCVITAVDWWPTFDIDIIAGAIKIKNPPSVGQMAKAWLLFAPDIPAQYGGSVPFGNGGICLSMFNDGEIVHTDGRGAKRIVYDPIMATYKMRGLVRHDAGVNTMMMVTLEIFRA